MNTPHATRHLAIAVLFSLPLLLNAQRRLDLHNYEMVWRDEFSYTDVDAMLDAGNWVVGWPGDALGTKQFHQFQDTAANGLGYATKFTKDNIDMKDGVAYFWGSVCDTLGSCGTVDIISGDTIAYPIGSYGGAITSTYDQDYPCSMQYYDEDSTIQTLKVKGFNYGVFEIRAKLPIEKADFSYFWLWGPYWQCGNENNHFSCGDAQGAAPCQLPYCSGFEIDAFETSHNNYHDVEKFRFFCTMQPSNADANPYPEPHQCSSCPTYYQWLNADPTETWHTYAVAWTPDSVTWFVDGNEIRTQRDYVPDLKMVLNLGANLDNYLSAGPQGKLAVDYVRLYRPAGGNYGPITDTSATSTMVTARDTAAASAYMQYVSLYHDAESTYFNQDNYGFNESDELPLEAGLVPTSSAMIEPFDSLGQQEIVPRCYFTLGDNKLYRTELQYRRAYLKYSDPLKAKQYVALPNGGTWVKSEIKSIHEEPGSMAMFPIVGHLFWRGTDNRMYMRINLDSIMPEEELYIVQMDTAGTQDVYGDVVAVEGNEIDSTALHPSRVYYRNGSNVLCYFEWDAADTVWVRKVTGINNVAGNLVAAKEPLGKLYYRGTDKNVWNVWQYAGGPASFQISRLDTMGDFDPYPVPYYPQGALAVSPDGYRVYYTANHGFWDFTRSDIICLFYVGNNSWVRQPTGINDFTGNRMSVLSLPDSLSDELIYLGKADTAQLGYVPALGGYRYDLHNKVKSIYVRPMVGKWAGGQLGTPYADFCVSTFDNLTTNHHHTYFVESHFFVNNFFGVSSSEPRVVFATANAANSKGSIGFYRRGSAELCPMLYEDCTWNPEVENGIEFREYSMDADGLSVYPNPSSGRVKVVLPSGMRAKGAWLTSLEGRSRSYAVDEDAGEISLDFSAQAPGFYVLRVLLDDGSVSSSKIILQTHP